MEMRNMLLGIGGKLILAINLAKNLAQLCSHSSVLWSVERTSDELAYLAEEISNHTFEGMAYLFLTA